MSDLKPYLMGRMQEMQRIDPAHWTEMRGGFIREFGVPSSVDDSLEGDDRQIWWLHWFGEYRVRRMKQQVPTRR